MKISFDDGDTWVEVKSVRISQEFPNPDDVDQNAELAFNFTHEGLVTDLWVDDVCQGSKNQLYLEIGDDLV
jgi:hypothetical protein